MNQYELGTALKLAREQCGKNQQEAADALGVSRITIVHIEQGNRQISSIELKRLADLYGRKMDEFFADSENTEETLVHLYRIAPGIEKEPLSAEEVGHVLTLSRKGAELANRIGIHRLNRTPLYEAKTPRTGADAIRVGTEVADQERRRLGLGSAPIADIAELICHQGIWASSTALPDGISGSFMKDPSIGMMIIVNAGHGLPRKRFSYAHEYAHALMDRERSVAVTSENGADHLIEKRANAFAAAFLMPKAGVEEMLSLLEKGGPSKQQVPMYDAASEGRFVAEYRTRPGSQDITFQDVLVVARHFIVSYQAAAYRLRGLGYVSEDGCAKLLKLEEGWNKPGHVLHALHKAERAPVAEESELHGAIMRFTLEAHRRGLLGGPAEVAAISRMLSMDESSLTALLQAAT